MSKWTAADIPDQRGRVAIVTGANSGLGKITSRELARAGAKVVMGCRDTAKGERAVAEIREAVPGAELELESLDLADLSAVREFAATVGERHPSLDLLINNAGVMATPRRETADGFEMQIGTNHLGHFALTGLLLERLLANAQPRVVTVSSGGHRGGRINFDDLHGERRYGRWSAYMQSKLANLLSAYELQRRATAAGSALRSVAAHPGYSSTHLQSSGPGLGGGLAAGFNTAVMAVTNRVIAQSEEMGALPSLYAATTADLPGGSYVGPDGMGELRGHPTIVGSSRASKDEAVAGRLWDLSVELTGVDYAALG